MGKLKGALFSLGASRSIGKAISFVRRRGVDIAETYPVPKDARSLAQLSWRHMFQKCTALWHALSVAEQQHWESLARRQHMTGYAYFQSQCLRPNPGIYLPLQGGTMQGDIDMAKYRILRLPAPADPQEAFRLSDYAAYVLPYLLREGAKASHTVPQVIPNAVWTELAFNAEHYDTDSIHDLLINNARLTCQTAGKYIITANVDWAANAVGLRWHTISLNSTWSIAYVGADTASAGPSTQIATTIYDLAVGDWVSVLVWQNTGGNLNILATIIYSPKFAMQRIG